MGGFVALLQSPLCTDDDIKNMFNLFEQHIDALQNIETKNKFQKLLAYLKTIQEKERISKEQDEKDIEEVFSSLDLI